MAAASSSPSGSESKLRAERAGAVVRVATAALNRVRVATAALNRVRAAPHVTGVLRRVQRGVLVRAAPRASRRVRDMIVSQQSRPCVRTRV
jgi:hypothetical protein